MMDDESRIMGLVEEILDSNIAPEDACRECPELLPAVRVRLERFRSVDARLFEVLPPHESSDERPIGVLRRASRALPAIPGHEVQRVLGRGGMGVVYEARHLKLDRKVAVKMLLAGEFASARELERFSLEARAVASLNHPNIVQ